MSCGDFRYFIVLTEFSGSGEHSILWVVCRSSQSTGYRLLASIFSATLFRNVVRLGGVRHPKAPAKVRTVDPPMTSSKLATQPRVWNDRKKARAIEAASLGMWSWNVISDKVLWDARCKTLFGHPETAPDIISYDEFIACIYPDDLAHTKEMLGQVLLTRGQYDVVHRVLWPDHSVHWVRCVGAFSETDPEMEMIGVTIDLSWFKRATEERVQMEEFLRRSNEELAGRVQERTTELKQSAAKILLQSRLLDLAHDAIFVCGVDQLVSFWNHGAEQLYGWTPQQAMGKQVHDLLHTEFPIPLAEILQRDHWEGELRHTKRDGSKITVASRWTTLRDEQGTLLAWLQINSDISRRKRAEHAAIRLSSRILKLQDEERRKIARDLHDSLGQVLTSLKINLELIQMEQSPESRNRTGHRLVECVRLVEQSLTETRTLSHLLHPPLLDEAGFASAARWYLEGFAKRSGLQVNFEIPSNLPRLRSNIELCLFRILQESLTNVHRHSGCTAVSVRVESNPDQVILTVIDNGKGISADRLKELRESNLGVGVGLAGMRERAMDLGGRLLFDSDESGTMVTAMMPLSVPPEESSEPKNPAA